MTLTQDASCTLIYSCSSGRNKNTGWRKRFMTTFSCLFPDLRLMKRPWRHFSLCFLIFGFLKRSWRPFFSLLPDFRLHVALATIFLLASWLPASCSAHGDYFSLCFLIFGFTRHSLLSPAFKLTWILNSNRNNFSSA